MAVIRDVQTNVNNVNHFAGVALLCGIVCSVFGLWKNFKANVDIGNKKKRPNTDSDYPVEDEVETEGNAGVYRPFRDDIYVTPHGPPMVRQMGYGPEKAMNMSAEIYAHIVNGNAKPAQNRSVNPENVQLAISRSEPDLVENRSVGQQFLDQERNESSRQKKYEVSYNPNGASGSKPKDITFLKEKIEREKEENQEQIFIPKETSTSLRVGLKLTKEEMKEEKKRQKEQRIKDKELVKEMVKEDRAKVDREAELRAERLRIEKLEKGKKKAQKPEKEKVASKKDKSSRDKSPKQENQSKGGESIMQIKEVANTRENVKGKSNPLAQPMQAATVDRLSDISKTSGPPPYTTFELNTKDDTGNTSFGKPVEEFSSSWDMVSQHRQQIKRPATASIQTNNSTKLEYRVGKLQFNDIQGGKSDA